MHTTGHVSEADSKIAHEISDGFSTLFAAAEQYLKFYYFSEKDRLNLIEVMNCLAFGGPFIDKLNEQNKVFMEKMIEMNKPKQITLVDNSASALDDSSPNTPTPDVRNLVKKKRNPLKI